MKDSVSIEFLRAIGTDKSGPGTAKYMQARCPMAFWDHLNGDKTPSFGISRSTQWGQCFGCGFSGSLFELVHNIATREVESPSPVKRDLARAYEILALQKETEELLPAPEVPYDEALFAKPVTEAWPEDYLISFDSAWHENTVHPYLASRNVSATTARRLDLRYDDYRSRICFPLRDGLGRLMGVHGRAIYDAITPHYWFYTRKGQSNPQVWHNEHQMDLAKPLIIAESVFDMAAIYPVWPNVITGRSAKMRSDMIERLKGASRIITWFDGDKAGDTARSFISDRISNVAHVVPEPGKDAGSTPQEEIQEKWDFIVQSDVFSLLSE